MISTTTDPVGATIDVLEAVDPVDSTVFLLGEGGSTTGEGGDEIGDVSYRYARPWPTSDDFDAPYDAGGAPDRIARSEAHDPSDKESKSRRTDVSLYVSQVEDATHAKQDAAGALDTTFVTQVDIWTADGDVAHAYKEAVVDVAQALANDMGRQTRFYDVTPQSDVDFRAQSFSRGAFSVQSTRIMWHRYRRKPANR